MSQRNVDIMRAAYDAFGSGEPMALLELLDPEIQWRAIEDPGGQTRRRRCAEIGRRLVRDGKIVAFHEYKSRREATAAAGL